MKEESKDGKFIHSNEAVGGSLSLIRRSSETDVQTINELSTISIQTGSLSASGRITSESIATGPIIGDSAYITTNITSGSITTGSISASTLSLSSLSPGMSLVVDSLSRIVPSFPNTVSLPLSTTTQMRFPMNLSIGNNTIYRIPSGSYGLFTMSITGLGTTTLYCSPDNGTTLYFIFSYAGTAVGTSVTTRSFIFQPLDTFVINCTASQSALINLTTWPTSGAYFKPARCQPLAFGSNLVYTCPTGVQAMVGGNWPGFDTEALGVQLAMSAVGGGAVTCTTNVNIGGSTAYSLGAVPVTGPNVQQSAQLTIFLRPTDTITVTTTVNTPVLGQAWIPIIEFPLSVF